MAEAPFARWFVSWSGGKDSCLAMHRHIAAGAGKPTALVTTFVEEGDRTRGHHLSSTVLETQAAALGVPLIARPTSWAEYTAVFADTMRELVATGVTEGVFGDIDLDAHREWVETVCGTTGVRAFEPLWLEPRAKLLDDFLGAGYEAVVVALRPAQLDPALLGRTLDASLIAEFEAAGIDACGEEGEYHTVVVDGPGFAHRVELRPGATFDVDDYRFLDLAVGDPVGASPASPPPPHAQRGTPRRCPGCPPAVRGPGG